MLLCAALALSVSALADFGDFSGSSDYDYDYDYDSGSSWSSSDYDYSDSWSSSDSSSSWSSSSSSSGSGGSVVALVVLLIIIKGMDRKKKKKKSARRAEQVQTPAYRPALKPISAYTQLDPNFNSAALCEKAANLYVQMQNGWTAKNIESLRPYFADALFTQMERSLQGYAQRGETNVVERIAVMRVEPLGFHQTGGEDHIVLRLQTRITDYTVNDRTGQVVRGSRDKEKFMTYEWELLRPTGVMTEAALGETRRITCLSCGAPLDVNASARCPYCGTVIQQQAQSWVIGAIRGIRQETR